MSARQFMTMALVLAFCVSCENRPTPTIDPIVRLDIRLANPGKEKNPRWGQHVGESISDPAKLHAVEKCLAESRATWRKTEGFIPLAPEYEFDAVNPSGSKTTISIGLLYQDNAPIVVGSNYGTLTSAQHNVFANLVSD